MIIARSHPSVHQGRLRYPPDWQAVKFSMSGEELSFVLMYRSTNGSSISMNGDEGIARTIVYQASLPFALRYLSANGGDA